MLLLSIVKLAKAKEGVMVGLSLLLVGVAIGVGTGAVAARKIDQLH